MPLVFMQKLAGMVGGTYAHKDIDFQFAMWISPEFQIYIVKEFLNKIAIQQMTILVEVQGRKLLK